MCHCDYRTLRKSASNCPLNELIRAKVNVCRHLISDYDLQKNS